MGRGRALVVLAAAAFGTSSSILAIASTSPNKVMEWPFLGPLDVVLVVVLVALMVVPRREAGPERISGALPATFAVATVVLPLLFFGLWLVQRSIDWNVLLPGLAWRSFVLLYTLPAALAVWLLPREPEGSA